MPTCAVAILGISCTRSTSRPAGRSGVRRLADLRGRDPWDLMHEINLEAGRPIWQPPMAIIALQNLVDASEREGIDPPAGNA